jgi:chorismate synthase
LHVKIIQDSASRFLKENATTLLTAGGVVGTVATGVLAFRAGVKYERLTYQAEFTVTVEDEIHLTVVDKAKIAAPYVIPAVAVSGAAVGAIIMANRLSAKEAAVLAAAYGISQKQLEEYKAKVAEKLTSTKQKQVDEEIAQERVDKNPVSNTIIVMGDDVLCFDMPTGRYFTSSMEKIRKAENAANAEIIQHGWAGADQFYDELEMEPTTWTKSVGWNDKFELEISHALAKDERPCLTINFSRMPDPNYRMDYS